MFLFCNTHNCIFVFLCCTKNCEKQEAVSLRHYILGQPNLFGLNFSQFLKKEEKESESIIVMKMKVKASRDTSHYILGQPNTLTQFSLNFLKKSRWRKTCHVLVSPVLFSIRNWLTQMSQQKISIEIAMRRTQWTKTTAIAKFEMWLNCVSFRANTK